jgi:hypothetical protein
VIKTSALLVVLAIGLLVAGVLASSLPMVYVSIGVCAVAALLLVVGVLSHWPEIFGRPEARPSGMQPSWSEPQMQVSAPVLAGAQATGTQVKSPPVTGVQTAGARTGGARTAGARARDTAAREERRSRRGAAAGRPPAPPAEVVTPQAESAGPGPGDDLWERVEEELGSAGKRDTGALSWPATEIPVLREPADAPEEAAPPGVPAAGSSAWIWGRGAGWQPPETPDEAWPPPAAAFAGSPARPERATTDADGADGAGQDMDGPDMDGPDMDGPDRETGQPQSAAPAGSARAAGEAPPESVDDEVAEQAPDTAPAKRDTWDERPRWIISVGDAAPARPVPDRAVSAPPASERTTGAAARQPAAGKPAAGKPAAGKPEAAEPKAAETEGAKPGGAETKSAKRGSAEPTAAEPEPTTAAVAASAGQEAPAKALAGPEPASREPAVDVPQAGAPRAEESAAEDSAAEESAAAGSPSADSAAEEPAAEEPAAEERADGEPAADRPAGKPAPGRIEVTVVPGVARYHRSGCILIRFLGAGDLEIMTRQEAVEAKLVACRACQPDQIEA